MKRLTLLITLTGLFTLGACNKKSENPPPGPASGAMTPPPPEPPPAGSAAPADAGSAGSAAAAASGSAAADLPTDTDFEDEAAKKITEKNVEAQVKAIETELGQH